MKKNISNEGLIILPSSFRNKIVNPVELKHDARTQSLFIKNICTI
jgi:hypothetical protein